MRYIQDVLVLVMSCIVGYFFALGVKFFWYTEVKGYVLTMPAGGYGEVFVDSGPKVTLLPLTVNGIAGERERVIDTGMENTVVVSVFHLYDNYRDLNSDYQHFMVDRGELVGGEVWGWSDCEWQPDQNYAACDVYTVRPTYVHAEMAFDTLGHEVWHGVAGDFHE